MSDARRVPAELGQAVAACAEHAWLTRRIEGAAPGLAAEEQRVAAARSLPDRQDAEVERLGSFSAAKIWAHLKCSHATDLEDETADREGARYAVAEAETRREVLLQVLGQEAGEAYDAGRSAQDLLGETASLLGSAGSWSTWAAFGGVGPITDPMKYDEVDRAGNTLRRAGLAWRRSRGSSPSPRAASAGRTGRPADTDLRVRVPGWPTRRCGPSCSSGARGSSQAGSTRSWGAGD